MKLIDTYLAQSARSQQDQEKETVSGRVQIGKNTFLAECKCSPNQAGVQQSSCNPTQYSIMENNKGNGYTPQQIQKFVGPVSDLTWTKITKSPFVPFN